MTAFDRFISLFNFIKLKCITYFQINLFLKFCFIERTTYNRIIFIAHLRDTRVEKTLQNLGR